VRLLLELAKTNIKVQLQHHEACYCSCMLLIVSVAELRHGKVPRNEALGHTQPLTYLFGLVLLWLLLLRLVAAFLLR
jgi:hypothetical protein